ncbi:hypothetical protein [Marinobacter nauticus]|uniref:hypothetical protein n=1 Tax=Marinobacter nauticus TaxID=2743 RepID=UPI0040443035
MQVHRALDDGIEMFGGTVDLKNLLVTGAGRSAKQHRAMVLREGSGGHFHNMIIDSFAIEAIDTRDEVRSLVAMENSPLATTLPPTMAVSAI